MVAGRERAVNAAGTYKDRADNYLVRRFLPAPPCPITYKSAPSPAEAATRESDCHCASPLRAPTHYAAHTSPQQTRHPGPHRCRLMDLPVPVVGGPQVANEQVRRLGEELERAGDALLPLQRAVALVEQHFGARVHLHQVVGGGLVAVEDGVQEFVWHGLVALEERGVAELEHARVWHDVGHVHAGPEAEVVLECVPQRGGSAAGEPGGDDFEAAGVGEVSRVGVVGDEAHGGESGGVVRLVFLS